MDVGDAVGGEEGLCATGEVDRGDRFLVGQGLGVGQAGEPVDRGVQVGVTAPGVGLPGGGVLGAFDLFGLLTAPAVDAPSAAVGDDADLLDVQVDHVAGPSGDDPPGRAVVKYRV
ncbi:hypothetical protein GCM10010185_52300 [Saccharothrix coeruleofusca]|uniref:Uncharacterized protein n=1 Tax=Saccharothrix coeruleofusca TaxID=33919 RepID=A0A918EGK6_9PSEU|nr:hypothetical protein GCM10010185_52300 [Saccharothrix coeruleofusca]